MSFMVGTGLLFNFVLSALTGLIAFFIAIKTYKAYKFIKSYRLGYFTLGFLSFFMFFWVKSFYYFVSALHASKITGTLTFSAFLATKLLINFFYLLSVDLILFSILSFKKHISLIIHLFMLALVVGVVFQSVFYIEVIVLLILINAYYIVNFIKTKTPSSKLVSLSLILLLITSIMFTITQDMNNLLINTGYFVSFIIFWSSVKLIK